MGFRFRRSLKIAPGLRLNIGKRGFTSVSVGGRGFRSTFGKKGVRHTVGLPGTGLSFTTHSPSSSRSTAFSRSAQRTESQMQPMVQNPERWAIHEQRISKTAGLRRIVLLTTGILLLFVMIAVPGVWGFGALALILLGLASPSRRTLLTAEQDRVQALARQELADRLTQFRAVLDQKSSADTVRQALALQQELKLTDDEVGVATVEVLQAALEFYEFEESSTADGLPKLAEHVRVTVPDACHFFVDGVVYDKRGDNDPTGALYLTSGRALFLAPEGLTAAPWSKVIRVSREGRTVGIQRRDRKTPLLFVFERLADALKAEYVVNRLLNAVGQDDPEQRASRDEPNPEPETPIGTTVELVGNGGVFELGIVGESYRQSALKALAAGRRARNEEVFFSAALVPNPTNPHDPNAIKVYIHGGEHVGFLSREDAVRYQPLRDALIARKAIGVCRAKLIGGTTGKPSIGVVLDVADPAAETAAISEDVHPF